MTAPLAAAAQSIDPAQELKNALEASGKWVNCQISNVTVTQTGPRPQIHATANQPVLVYTGTWENCSDDPEKHTVTWDVSKEEEFNWSLSGTVSYSAGATATVGIPGAGSVGGTTSWSFSVTGGLSGTEKTTKTITGSVEITVPPLKWKKYEVLVQSADFSGTATIRMRITGEYTCTMVGTGGNTTGAKKTIVRTITANIQGVAGWKEDSHTTQGDAACEAEAITVPDEP